MIPYQNLMQLIFTVSLSCLFGYLGENEDGRLSDGFVKYKYCGTYNPPVITSIGPRMVITLNTTGALQGGKFLARYAFITGKNSLA